MNCVILFRHTRYPWGYVRAVVVIFSTSHVIHYSNISDAKNALGVITQKTTIQLFTAVKTSTLILHHKPFQQWKTLLSVSLCCY
jgi:hypothetical protein